MSQREELVMAKLMGSTVDAGGILDETVAENQMNNVVISNLLLV